MYKKELYTPVCMLLTGLYMYVCGRNGITPGVIGALASFAGLAWFFSPARSERINEQREMRRRRAECARLKRERARNVKRSRKAA